MKLKETKQIILKPGIYLPYSPIILLYHTITIILITHQARSHPSRGVWTRRKCDMPGYRSLCARLVIA